MLGHGRPQPCWGLTSVSQHLKIKQACGVKIIVILITVFVVVENALTPRFSNCFCHKNTSRIDADASEKFVSKSHSLVVFSVIIFEMLLFQTQIRFRPPLFIIFRTEMPLFQTQIQFRVFRPPLWHDFAEKWRISNGKGTYIRCWCIWEVCLP